MKVISGAIALPDETFGRLVELARRDRRSARDQAELILEDALGVGWRLRQLLDELDIPPDALVALLETRIAERGREPAAEPASQAAG